MVIIRQLFFSSSVIIAHFGKNPVSGGRPPRERRINGINTRVVGALFHRSEIELIVVDALSISMRNMGTVRII